MNDKKHKKIVASFQLEIARILQQLRSCEYENKKLKKERSELWEDLQTLDLALEELKARWEKTYDIRPELLNFAMAMEKELKRHDAKKLKSWKAIDLWNLEEMIRNAVKTIEYEGQDIDVANLCMMHFDNAHKMQELSSGYEAKKVTQG